MPWDYSCRSLARETSGDHERKGSFYIKGERSVGLERLFRVDGVWNEKMKYVLFPVVLDEPSEGKGVLE